MEIEKKAKINIHWNVSPYDFSKEKQDSLTAKASYKYGIPKDRIKIIPNFIVQDTNNELSTPSDIIHNIQDPRFQLKLFKDYLDLNKIENYDFEIIKAIDSEINANIDYKVYDKYRRYSIKWIRFSNFLSYGADNYIDFTNNRGLILLSGEPANQSGKTALSIDLLHFLLFGTTNRFKTQDKIFNKHLPQATNVSVEGCINIDGVDYVIKRTLSRPNLTKRSDKSKTTQKVEYYKLVGEAREELLEYADNMQEESSVQTNKVIKEAIGRESDFDLIMSVTESTLDELIEKKEAERGRLLSRWIGLLPIEEKDIIAREKFNSEIKPKLLSNRFNVETLTQEISAFELNAEVLKNEIKKYYAENERTKNDIEKLEKSKTALLLSKRNVDEKILKVDIVTLNSKMESSVSEGKKKTHELDEINKEIKEIGDVSFSVEEYDALVSEKTKISNEIAVIGEKYKNIDHNIKHLKSSEICPTCHRKLDNVDNSKRINELEKELNDVLEDGKKKRVVENELSNKIEKLKNDRALYDKKSKLIVKKSAIEVNIEKLRSEYKENLLIKKEYEKNSEAIDANNKLDIEIRNTEIFIKEKRATIDTNSSYIIKNESDLKSHNEQIETRKEIINKIKEEEILLQNWKIYLELVGKNGISKMVLRKTLPIINAKLSQLLCDVCDFRVEVGITQKNEVTFYLIKDNVYSDLYSGSGFEKTAASLALRSVLADMSTIPRCNGVIWDEIFGRIAKENYDNIKHLCDKISESYDWIFIISHNDEIKDWCSSHIIVRKENNISKIVFG